MIGAAPSREYALLDLVRANLKLRDASICCRRRFPESLQRLAMIAGEEALGFVEAEKGSSESYFQGSRQCFTNFGRLRPFPFSGCDLRDGNVFARRGLQRLECDKLASNPADRAVF